LFERARDAPRLLTDARSIFHDRLLRRLFAMMYLLPIEG
jgi:hypothetical protein